MLTYLGGDFEIRLTPGDPRADIAARCNMLTAVILAVAAETSRLSIGRVTMKWPCFGCWA